MWMWCEKAVGKNIAPLNVGKRATPHKCKLFPLTLAKIQIFSVAKCKLFPLHKYIWSGLDKWRKYCWCPLSCINMHKYAPRKSAIFQCIISCTFKHFTTREGFFHLFFCFILCSKSAIVCPCHSSFPAQNYNFACSCQGGDKSIGSGKKSEFSCCTNTFSCREIQCGRLQEAAKGKLPVAPVVCP